MHARSSLMYTHRAGWSINRANDEPRGQGRVERAVGGVRASASVASKIGLVARWCEPRTPVVMYSSICHVCELSMYSKVASNELTYIRLYRLLTTVFTSYLRYIRKRAQHKYQYACSTKSGTAGIRSMLLGPRLCQRSLEVPCVQICAAAHLNPRGCGQRGGSESICRRGQAARARWTVHAVYSIHCDTSRHETLDVSGDTGQHRRILHVANIKYSQNT